MRISNLAKALRSRLHRRRSQPVVLMYHRVASVRHDPWGLAVEPHHFEEQIAYLKEHRTPMSMGELVHSLGTNSLPANAVAITFDDGYRDNLVNAKPVLAKYGVPATVFLATGYVDSTSPFWWDELATMVLESAHPSQRMEVCAGEPIALEWGEPEALDLTGTWRAADGPRTKRQQCYLALWSKVQRATVEERDRVMRSLRQSFETISAPLAMPMSSVEITSLLADDVVKIGAHTVEHVALTSLSQSESRREIGESGRACSVLSDTPVAGFAYPYGDVDLETRENVTLAGFGWACTTRSAFVDRDRPDVYDLPRIAVPNVPLRQFTNIITQ
jgi:peptidoglycan/xylan/chitin deacetylase (PgdA/CDA1 family)